MSGHRKWSEIRRDRTPERDALAEAFRRATDAVLKLAEMRAEQGVTDEELSHALEESQERIGRIEHRTDVYLSTVENYVRALGGELRLCAVFPDGQEIPLDLDASPVPARVPVG